MTPPRKRSAWITMRERYISDESVTYASLAKEFGYSERWIEKRASKEGWRKLRANQIGPFGKTSEKVREKTSTKQADIEAKAIEIAGGIMVLHGYKVQGLHDKIKKAKAIKDETKREAAVDDILTSTDYVEYLKAHKLPDIGKYIRLMCGLPDSRQGWRSEPAMTQEEADVLLRALARVEEDKDEHRRALRWEIGASPYETKEPGKTA